MTPATEPASPDLIAEFGHHAYYHLIHTLLGGLPLLPANDPEALLRRNHAAISRIAALCPANSAEAETASLYVAASEQWKHCLYLAQLPETAFKQAMQCRNQANSMMRQAQGALRLLLRMQAVREKRESTNQSCDRAAFTEHWNTTLMAEALAAQPSPAATAAQPSPPATAAQPPAQAAAADPPPAPLAAPLAAADCRVPDRRPSTPIALLRQTPSEIRFRPPQDGMVLGGLTRARNR